MRCLCVIVDGICVTVVSIIFIILFNIVTIPDNCMVVRSGAKKPPAPIEFDPTDPLHLEFITASANLRASVYGLPPCSDPSVVASVAVQVVVPLFRCVSFQRVILCIFIGLNSSDQIISFSPRDNVLLFIYRQARPRLFDSSYGRRSQGEGGPGSQCGQYGHRRPM